jgi:hypothetical protein
MDDTPAVETVTTLLRHEGELTAQAAEELVVTMRGHVDAGRITRAAFSAFVELVQNVRIHGTTHPAMVTVTNLGNGLLEIHTRSIAPETDARKACEAVDCANRNSANLRTLIREARKGELPVNARGAGLGIMEIRRLCATDVYASHSPCADSNSELVIIARLAHK